MRLSPLEHSAILDCAREFFGATARVRLFGSHADDRMRGGDIDLHVELGNADRSDIDSELGFALALQDRIGERKIDVIVRKPGYVPRAIDRIALSKGIDL